MQDPIYITKIEAASRSHLEQLLLIGLVLHVLIKKELNSITTTINDCLLTFSLIDHKPSYL